LKILSLNDNQIQSTRNAPSLPSLQYLSLRGNNLNDILKLVEYESLKGLDVSSNNIGAIPEGFTSLKALEVLNMSSNNIKAVYGEVFSKLVRYHQQVIVSIRRPSL